MKLERVDAVVGWRLCMGCGMCSKACPNGAITLVDIVDRGIRPIVDEDKCRKCSTCVQVCPGVSLVHKPFPSGAIPSLKTAWGPVLEVWEGYAVNDEIRYRGSSGGVATALALFSLESKKACGVLHTGVDSENPLRNIPVFSRDRDSLISCTGSRYAPATPCERLDLIEQAEGACVFIGKPCDVAALQKYQAINPKMKTKIGLTISIFCAGTPTTKGTHKILQRFGLEPDEVVEFRYRGQGWPGKTTAIVRNDGSRQQYEMTYEESWGDILSKHGQLRCRLCPDSTGEFADISCGDPWYRQPEPNDPGRSLVLVRTARGRQFLKEAIQADYVSLEQAKPDILPRSQVSLLNRRRHLCGRMLAMCTMRIPMPRFKGFSLFSNWRDLSVIGKTRSLMGTFKRIILRKLYKPFTSFQK